MTTYIFHAPGNRLEFDAEPYAAQQILTALLSHWSGDHVVFGRHDLHPYHHVEAGSRESYALAYWIAS